jgi:hypothetical protein
MSVRKGVASQQPPSAARETRLHAVLTAGLLRQHAQATAAQCRPEHRPSAEREADEWTWETQSSSKCSVYSKESLVSVGTAAFEETLLAHVQGAEDIGAKKKMNLVSRATKKKQQKLEVKRKAKSKAKSKVVKKVKRAKTQTDLVARAAKKKQQKLVQEYTGYVRVLLKQVNELQRQVEVAVRDQRDYGTLVLAWVDDRGNNNRAQRTKYKKEWQDNVQEYDIKNYGEEMSVQMRIWGNRMNLGNGASSEEAVFIKAWTDLQKAVATLHKYNNETYLSRKPKLSYTEAPGAEGWKGASEKNMAAATARANEAYAAIKAAVDKLPSESEWDAIDAALASYWKKTSKSKGLAERVAKWVL